MRDPKRIDRILAAVRRYWLMHPDLRLAQIVGNAAEGDPYHLEDDDLLAVLEDTLVEHEWAEKRIKAKR